MPAISLNEGNSFHYDDSGPPSATGPYTSFIVFHGMGFSGAVFKPLFPVASEEATRIFSFSRRGHAESSPISEADWKLILGTDDDKARYLSDYGINLALLVDHLIVEEKLTKVVVVAWSFGDAFVTSMVANLHAVPDDTAERLREHLHGIILHDASTRGTGIENPKGFDNSLFFIADVKERFEAFRRWCVGYYSHEDINSHDPSKLSYNVPTNRPPTFHDLGEQELEKMSSWEAFSNVDLPVLLFDFPIYNKSFHRAFLDPTTAKELLPDLKVRFLYGKETIGTSVYVSTLLEDGGKRVSDLWNGQKERDVEVVQMEKGNHFSFWDYPRETLHAYQKSVGL